MGLALALLATLSVAQDLVVVEDFQKRRSAGRKALTTAEDIKDRVIRAGGNTEGVVVASLAWSTPDDLDLHVITPGGAEISYRNRQARGGELDVDMCVHGRHGSQCTDRPVENVVFTDEAPQGRYEVYVQNFAYHPIVRSKELQVAQALEGKRPSKQNHELRFGRDRPVPFEVLVKVQGAHRVFSGLCTPAGKTHGDSNVRVFAFEYFPHALTDEGRLIPAFEASSRPECEEFKQRLLESGDDRQNYRLPGAQPQHVAGRPSAAAPGRKSATPRQRPQRSQAAGKRRKSRRAQALEEAKEAALQVVRGASYDTLLAKPASALRELLTDLGITCRGCLEKKEIAGRLRKAAGLPETKDEL
mmetsp:Transcript_118270/g.228276  ORF Transcript_118270/g.228276 Transcript_118270/m.228276 type:complete len:359 (-) Transcript_118270:29-1105(-)